MEDQSKTSAELTISKLFLNECKLLYIVVSSKQDEEVMILLVFARLKFIISAETPIILRLFVVLFVPSGQSK